ncbi:RNA-binding domain-containing protein [Polychaeton citri CBS 116435]|uniref:RNA-binding domain-containing protein n=1 Tax=Polychaeton citri CBS 116435 TaxID=1314669 RepID=A0A9P4Q1Z6_9PEZI|nr:RNA-binding domain-containing protein [Polychaeton citri CBS 116435]
MFHLRRAAARALSRSSALKQPSQFTSFTLSPRQSVATNPSLVRSFHQSLQWRATDDKDVTEAKREETREESIATPDVASSYATAADAVAESSGSTSAPLKQREFSSFERRPRRSEPIGDHRAKVPSKILYLGNLFFDVTAADLEAEFAKYGEVVNCRVVSDERGMSKGFGYVELSSQEEADRAIQDGDQNIFQGRRMKVDYHIAKQRPTSARQRDPRPPRPVAPPSKTLFIGNMNYQMSDRDLNDVFREIRDVVDVRIAIDRRTGQPRGFAHADFIDIASAQKAKEILENMTVFGRQLRVDFTGESANSPGPRVRTTREST